MNLLIVTVLVDTKNDYLTSHWYLLFTMKIC